MRERWWGATGRRIPELAVEGEIELDDALVLDGVGELEPIRVAFEQGRPVVVRAGSAEEIKAALARPEIACVLVPAAQRNLLDLDLTELTYG